MRGWQSPRSSPTPLPPPSATSLAFLAGRLFLLPFPGSYQGPAGRIYLVVKVCLVCLLLTVPPHGLLLRSPCLPTGLLRSWPRPASTTSTIFWAHCASPQSFAPHSSVYAFLSLTFTWLTVPSPTVFCPPHFSNSCFLSLCLMHLFSYSSSCMRENVF